MRALFFSIGQLLSFTAVGIVFACVATSADFPLMDDFFARLDAAMGFRWQDANAWFQQHLWLEMVLWAAYLSTGVQLMSLFLIHCTIEPRKGSGELIWIYMLGLLIVIAISVFLPAKAMSGIIGQHHIDVFLAARARNVTTLNETNLTGIIAFPSFHTVVAVIMTYSARVKKWLLAVFAPVNVLLIVATVPCGGHYLVDTIAGPCCGGGLDSGCQKDTPGDRHAGTQRFGTWRACHRWTISASAYEALRVVGDRVSEVASGQRRISLPILRPRLFGCQSHVARSPRTRHCY